MGCFTSRPSKPAHSSSSSSSPPSPKSSPPPTTITSKEQALSPAVQALSKSNLVLLHPSTSEYEARQSSYWSSSAKQLSPSCIIQPRNAGEVGKALRILTTTKTSFAIRSGGHMQWAGANSIGPHGVTIDLGLLSWTRYDAASDTVDLGPGGVWRDVYHELHSHGRVVAGGREGNVGVAGLILGGGNTFFTPRAGFACDNVVEFEVVLADGSVVTADGKGENADLFWALKGGGNNFGIVTNFKMKTFVTGQIWAGLTFYPKQVTQPAAQALVEFTDGMESDPDSNLLCFFAYTPQFKDVGIATMSVQVAGVEKAPAYDKWLALPSIMTTCKMTTVPELVSDPANNLPRQYHDIWFTASFKNDVRIIAKAAELHEAMVDEFKAFIPDGDFWTQCLFQPLPTLFGRRSAEAGGNTMGVERQKHNGVLFQAAAMVRTPEQEAFAYPKVRDWIAAVREFAATIEDGNLEWVYLNYSDRSQNPLGSYGLENVGRLAKIAAKYDPEGVFQKLCPGGFKISAANI
ncbi:hypothetical protein B0T17DRAFT_600017 [Bombardia bombarda]|uniref:FAD-binding PCMH-type domain-containing protein n=1 Tax=Bombardia bombarda TaxID=252184 RepID=A0AA40C5K8_9PEZI|nr:hypothetical protein B0T17DRAFT_600017 [Bombardia bombarda]